MADDTSIHEHITSLVQEERDLRRRLAAGEISREEEQARLKDIESGSTSAATCCGSAMPVASSTRTPPPPRSARSGSWRTTKVDRRRRSRQPVASGRLAPS